MSGIRTSRAPAVWGLGVVALAAVMLLAGCGRDVPATAEVGMTTIAPAEREPLPTIAGPTLQGAPLDVSALRGKVVVLNSWASWCEPCKDEVPALVAFAKEQDPQAVAVVGLNVSDESAAAEAFVKAYGISYPSIVDESAERLATIPGVPPKSLPSTVVIDKNGRIAARIIGVVDPQKLSDVVASVSGEPPGS